MSELDPKDALGAVASDGDDEEIEILEIVGLDDESGSELGSAEAQESEELVLDFDGDDGVGDPVEIAEDSRSVEKERVRLLRLQADFENFQRRVERDREDDQRQAAARVLGRLLPVLDNFERAIASAAVEDSSTSLHQGVQLIFRQIIDELRKEGLEAIPTMGEPFDPVVHEAVVLEEHTELPHHTIMEELLRGYTLHGKLLRPASVKVSTQPGIEEDAWMAKAIGIDLGTTNCCVSVMEGGKAKVIATKEGARTVPSIVAFTARAERLVGQIAKRQALTNPTNTFYAIKRLVGRKFDSPEVAKAAQLVPYQIVPSKNGDAWVRVRDKDYSPPEISAFLLQHLKELAEDYLGAEVSEAVVTVPAYFDDAQRQATKDAGRIAGLNVLRIVNEPTAASLAYGMDEGTSARKIAVFDLGGGTFDISILQLGEGVFEVKSTSGDTFLGGEDFDHRIVDWLLHEFREESGVDLRSDRMALQRLKEAAEKAKCELSMADSAEINLPFISANDGGAQHLHTTLSREKLEELVDDLVLKTRGPCEEALKLAGLDASEIDEILLVGGQTRMPKVVETVRDIFGREPSSEINPDEVVGVGAAVQAGIIKGDVKDLVLLDVTPLSLGIETRGGMFTKIIERSATIPTRKSKVFTTVADNQTKVEIHVLQGEREIAAHNNSLGQFELVGIPAAPRGATQIEVTFDIDSNGIVSVQARDLTTQREQKILVTPASGLSESEIEEIITDAKQHAEDDRRRAEFIRAHSRLEGLVESNQKTFNEFGSMLPPDQQVEARKILDDARQALESGNAGDCTEALEKIAEMGRILSEVILYDPGALTSDSEGDSSGGA